MSKQIRLTMIRQFFRANNSKKCSELCYFNGKLMKRGDWEHYRI